MNYTQKSKIKQDSATKNIVSDAWIGIIMLPSRLVGFTNYETTIEKNPLDYGVLYGGLLSFYFYCL